MDENNFVAAYLYALYFACLYFRLFDISLLLLFHCIMVNSSVGWAFLRGPLPPLARVPVLADVFCRSRGRFSGLILLLSLAASLADGDLLIGTTSRCRRRSV